MVVRVPSQKAESFDQLSHLSVGA